MESTKSIEERATKPLKIIELKAENIKNLKAIEIKPDGTAVVLSGRNGAGKSAVLDSIFSALTGEKLEKPIRNGEHRAEINVDMGSFTVRKIFTEKGARLEVMNKDGDVKKTPQQFLDNLLGKLSFDPLEFANTKPRAQRDLLKDIVGLSFDDLNAEQKDVYDARTLVNNEIKKAIVMLKDAGTPNLDTPSKEVSFKAHLDVINNLREKRDVFIKAVEAKKHSDERVKRNSDLVLEYRDQIVEIQEKIDSLLDQNVSILTENKDKVVPLEITEEQIQEAQDKLAGVENLNVRIRSVNRYRKLVHESNKLKEDADKLTSQINRIEQDKSTRTANATFPIEGLSINDDSVTFEGVPFSQLSTGQQIRVSTAIAMALNPNMKVILCREGSLLDSDGMKEVVALAKDKDYQLWIERVSDDDKVGIYIENGSIKAINGEEVENVAQDVYDSGQDPVEEE